jgi:hypothetical protein
MIETVRVQAGERYLGCHVHVRNQRVTQAVTSDKMK